MSTTLKTISEVRRSGIRALTKALGAVDAIRFLQQYDSGQGDYTADRHAMLGDPSVDKLIDDIKKRRNRHGSRPR